MRTGEELNIALRDTQWPMTYTDHDRVVVRAIVVDDAGDYYFVRAVRDDEFGAATLIETSGGGVEPGESLREAIVRELREELGVEVDILGKIGVVSDYYNLIHRHNLNHYFLCRVRGFGEKHQTPDEIEKYHLSTLKLDYDGAVTEYERRSDTPLGRLIAQRELPVLRRARGMLRGGRASRVWCLGDSNTFGFDPRDCSSGRVDAPWPERLAAMTKLEVVNDGANGRRIPWGAGELARVRADEERLEAGTAVILLGVNDLLNGLSPREAARRMGALLHRLGVPEILLVAPPPLRRGAWVPDDALVTASRELAPAYRELADGMGIGFADAGAWEIPLAFDGVHFTEEGHARFARGLAERL